MSVGNVIVQRRVFRTRDTYLIFRGSDGFLTLPHQHIKGELIPLKPSGHYMYYQSNNIQQFYVLPTQCIYVFCVDLRTNSDYFPMQH